jgi:hypothetical protein
VEVVSGEASSFQIAVFLLCLYMAFSLCIQSERSGVSSSS